MQTPLIGGNHYLLTFIDDYTRKTWVFLLKQKSEVFECFCQYKALVEKQSGHYNTVLRTDRGGEYISMISFIFVGNMEFTSNLQHVIHLNKMV